MAAVTAPGTVTPTGTTVLTTNYWLVWPHIGTDAQILAQPTKPPGGYVTQIGKVGDTFDQLITALSTAVVKAPTGYDAPSKFTIPGFTGTGTIKGPGGIAGTLDAGPAAVQGLAENLIGGAGGFAELAVRILEALVGVAAVLLGLQALTGGHGNPVQAVKDVHRKVRRL